MDVKPCTEVSSAKYDPCAKFRYPNASLSTVHREYAALRGLEYYDLFEDIVHPKKVALPRVSAERIQECMSKYGVNEPQASAIVGSLQNRGFSLIQGLVRS